MRRYISKIVFIMLLLGSIQVHAQKSILVFHKTEGFHHKSIEDGIRFFEEMAAEHDFKVKDTDQAEIFSEREIKKYDLVVFLNTTGNVLNENQQKAFEDYINSGGNYFGIHAAADTEFEWPWYGDLVGAYFVNHPKVSEAEIQVKIPSHPTVNHLPEVWTRTDEWYNYEYRNQKIQVLLNLDESTYAGGKNGKNHPIAWFQELSGGGKSIYTGLGHTSESYQEEDFRKLLLKSVLFALANE